MKNNLLNVNNWAADRLTHVMQISAAIAANANPFMYQLRQPMKQMEILFQSHDDKLFNDLLSTVSKQAITEIKTKMITIGHMFTTSFYLNLTTLQNASELGDIVAFPIYAIKAKFMNLCKDMTTTMEAIFIGAASTMKRMRVASRRAQIFDVRRVPWNFVPVVFPYLQIALHLDWWSANNGNDNDVTTYVQSVQERVNDEVQKMIDNIAGQMKMARDMLSIAIQVTPAYDDNAKMDMLNELNGDFDANQDEIGGILFMVNDTIDDLVPTSFGENDEDLHPFLQIVQELGYKVTKDLNNLGGQMMNDIINMYDILIVQK